MRSVYVFSTNGKMNLCQQQPSARSGQSLPSPDSYHLGDGDMLLVYVQHGSEHPTALSAAPSPVMLCCIFVILFYEK